MEDNWDFFFFFVATSLISAVFGFGIFWTMILTSDGSVFLNIFVGMFVAALFQNIFALILDKKRNKEEENYKEKEIN